MKTKLKNIADINLGYPFRNQIKHDSDGNYFVIQMKDIDENSEFNPKNIITVNIDNLKPDYLIQEKDILFKARGSNNESILINNHFENTIAAPQFFTIRIKTKKVLAEYLWWYLNNKKAQNYFKRMSSGTAVRMINRKALEELEVELPTLEKQKIIAQIAMLIKHETELVNKITLKKQVLIEQMLLNESKRK